MVRTRLLVIACLATVGLSAAPAPAALLVEYNVLGANATVSLTQNATQVAAGLSAGSLSPGAGLTPGGFTNTYAFTGWTTGGSPDPDDYIAFTVTPNAGNSITYDSISFRLVSNFNDPRGPQSWELRGSTDGFASATLLANFPSTGGGFTVGPLSVAALGTTASAVEFRLYGFDAESSDSFGGLGYDFEFPDPPGIVLTGTVQPAAVPEPASVALLGVSAAGLATGRFRRRA